MGPEVIITYEQIEQFPDRVRLIYAEFDKLIRADSDLHRCFALCEGILQRKNDLTLSERLEFHQAQRILEAIVNCYDILTVEERSAFKGLIAQIEANSLAPKEPSEFDGLNAVFELEYIQYLRHRKVSAKLGEPDIVVSTRFGDYHVACKSINSFRNIKRHLEKAAEQIAKRGFGFVALNFEPHVHYDGVVTTDDPREVFRALDKNAIDLYKAYEDMFNDMLKTGGFDGITIQICCIARLIGQETDLNTMAHNVYYSRSEHQSKAAVERFNYFRSAMQGPNSFFR
ncbi:hypothetical protein BJN42_26580 [Pseudomonas koreensis]|nr:hypothetical protein BJN42_26580 [Pseudomonas koreensis]